MCTESIQLYTHTDVEKLVGFKPLITEDSYISDQIRGLLVLSYGQFFCFDKKMWTHSNAKGPDIGLSCL